MSSKAAVGESRARFGAATSGASEELECTVSAGGSEIGEYMGSSKSVVVGAAEGLGFGVRAAVEAEAAM
eukprot:5102034-Amphidinium_carterae.1